GRGWGRPVRPHPNVRPGRWGELRVGFALRPEAPGRRSGGESRVPCMVSPIEERGAWKRAALRTNHATCEFAPRLGRNRKRGNEFGSYRGAACRKGALGEKRRGRSADQNLNTAHNVAV